MLHHPYISHKNLLLGLCLLPATQTFADTNSNHLLSKNIPLSQSSVDSQYITLKDLNSPEFSIKQQNIPTKNDLITEAELDAYNNAKLSEPHFNDELGSQYLTIADKQKLLEKKTTNKTTNKTMNREETLSYLAQHPQELEIELAKMLKAGHIQAIRDYLPLYKEYKNRDESLVEWSEAILAQGDGDLAKAISVFRNLNTKFPNIRVLQFQMVSVLMKNGQYNTALAKLKKMRNNKAMLDEERKGIENLITAIKNKDKWSFYATGNYVDDNNITNSPKEGTDYGNGWKAGARESGKGIKLSANANKQWNYDNKAFTELDLSSYGTYYFDNKGYNTVTARTGLGVGYRDKDYSIKLTPNFSKQLYGLAKKENASLKNYKTGVGIELEGEYTLSDKMRYDATLGFNKDSYIDDYENNDSKDYSLSQTVSYNYSPATYFYGGSDLFKRKSVFDYNSFNRAGLRFGWGQVWPKQFFTRANVGYAKKSYDGVDFFGVKRLNDEYRVGLSVWNNKISMFGLTPRLNWNYEKTDSNSARERLTKNNVYLSIAKSF